ncbi:MAG: hypothetical protein HPY62_01715 [Bacteroidales bacterium]|nr:hypothetical protein [Bacteroidales bacterium]
MKKRLVLYLFVFTSVICCDISGLNSQVLQDTSIVRKINEGLDAMYNLEFKKADDFFDGIYRLYPDHPVSYLLKGINTYWKYYPLVADSPARSIFEENLKNCIRLSEEKPYSENYEAESILVNICARALLALFYADNGLVINVVPLVSGTYKYLRKSFELVAYYSDFYFFTGIYNYYREAYPRVRPVYKTLASLFPPGDMAKGLRELVTAAEKSIFLKVEAYSILTWIYTGFENNFLQASLYSNTLTNRYPANLYFKSMHIKNLLLLKQYDKAESLAKEMEQTASGAFFMGQLMVFNALIQENKYKNYDLAKKLYERGINTLSQLGEFGNEYSAYAYFGLSRVCESSGDKTCKKSYRRKAEELATFKKINFD